MTWICPWDHFVGMPPNHRDIVNHLLISTQQCLLYQIVVLSLHDQFCQHHEGTHIHFHLDSLHCWHCHLQMRCCGYCCIHHPLGPKWNHCHYLFLSTKGHTIILNHHPWMDQCLECHFHWSNVLTSTNGVTLSSVEEHHNKVWSSWPFSSKFVICQINFFILSVSWCVWVVDRRLK